MKRVGLDRTAVAYDDPRAPEKRFVVERMNRDRSRFGVPPLRYDNRAALRDGHGRAVSGGL